MPDPFFIGSRKEFAGDFYYPFAQTVRMVLFSEAIKPVVLMAYVDNVLVIPAQAGIQ